MLGDAHVDASLAAATEFSRDIQDYVTQYCWGDLWNRPGLSLQERSLINLSMIVALNRSQEFKAHVRGAVNNGVSREQIKEVLMQAPSTAAGRPRWRRSATPPRSSRRWTPRLPASQ